MYVVGQEAHPAVRREYRKGPESRESDTVYDSVDG